MPTTLATPRPTRQQVKQANTLTAVEISKALLRRANIDVKASWSVSERLGDLSLGEVARECLELDAQRIPENDQDRVRAALSGAGTTFQDVFTTAVTTATLSGYTEQPDNAAGLYVPMPVQNFKQQKTLVLDDLAELQWLPRGETAEHVDISVSSGAWFLSRNARQIVLSEEDIADAADTGGLMLISQQLGAAAKRLELDLFFATLLSNPTLDVDSKALFHADHSNLATAALDATSLAAAIAAMGGQTKTTTDGDPIHLNIRPHVLIVPSNLDSAARTAVRAIKLDDPEVDIEVRSESRIGATGCVNPETGEVVTGSATNWYLASKSKIYPGFILGHLSGSRGPSVRSFTLDRGQWGMGWDIKSDIGVVVVGFESWYYSDGTV